MFDLALSWFAATWLARYGVAYATTPADRSQLGRMLRSLSPAAVDELPGAFAAYLNDLSPFVAQEMRHSLRYFCTSGGVNKYRTGTPILSKREATAAAAGQQWLAMTEGGKGNGAKR